MRKHKALFMACCALLVFGGIPVQGARIPKSEVSQNKILDASKAAAAVFGTTTKALDLIDLTQEEKVSRIGEMCRLDYARTGVLASVTAAQCILESGFLASELASEANNCFGMKAALSNNDWENSTWDGESIYRKETREEYGGQVVTIQAEFRQYNSVEESMADHSAYLLGAKKDGGLRYPGLESEEDYRKAVQIIKDGGYATDSSYVDKVCGIIERYDLTRFDDLEGVEIEKDTGAKKASSASGSELAYRDGYYRVRKEWTDIDSQLGAFGMLENAKSACGPGYHVYDSRGNVVYSYSPEEVVASEE